MLACLFMALPTQAAEESATAKYVRAVAGPAAAARYTAFIEKSAARWNLDPLLVARVIRLESEFKPREVSHVGAIGLMQVMPFHFTRKGIPPKKRMDPATNIELGCHLLSWYIKRMDLSYPGLSPEALFHRTLVAYNMGPKAVSRGIYRSRYSEIILSRYLTEPPRETASSRPESPLLDLAASASLEPAIPPAEVAQAVPPVPLPPPTPPGFQEP